MAIVRDFKFRADVGSTRLLTGASRNQVRYTQQARQGMAGIIRNYQRLTEEIKGVTPEILLTAMHVTYEKSQYYVPVRTGVLKASGYLVITNRGEIPQVEIGYGRGGSPDYATLQHENMEFGHRPPTRAKFLQAALEETLPTVRAQVIGMLRNIERYGMFKPREMIRGSGNVRLR